MMIIGTKLEPNRSISNFQKEIGIKKEKMHRFLWVKQELFYVSLDFSS